LSVAACACVSTSAARPDFLAMIASVKSCDRHHSEDRLVSNHIGGTNH
jgi:hypothetical protein